MAAVPEVGRATAVEQELAAEAGAVRELYERYSGQIFGFCLHQLGTREEAEDAVQSTFLNALRGLQRGVVPRIESAWLFKIAHNVCLTRRRSAARRGRVEFPNDLQAIEAVTPAPGRTSDELARLGEALSDLPETQRRAILLREWQGLSYREIAAELDTSQSAVETLIFRARRSLARGLGEQRPASRLRRLRPGADLGSALAGLKALLTGGTAVKVAAAVVAVGAATAVGSGPLRHHVPVPGGEPAARAPQSHAAVIAGGEPLSAVEIGAGRALPVSAPKRGRGLAAGKRTTRSGQRRGSAPASAAAQRAKSDSGSAVDQGGSGREGASAPANSPAGAPDGRALGHNKAKGGEPPSSKGARQGRPSRNEADRSKASGRDNGGGKGAAKHASAPASPARAAAPANPAAQGNLNGGDAAAKGDEAGRDGQGGGKGNGETP